MYQKIIITNNSRVRDKIIIMDLRGTSPCSTPVVVINNFNVVKFMDVRNSVF